MTRSAAGRAQLILVLLLSAGSTMAVGQVPAADTRHVAEGTASYSPLMQYTLPPDKLAKAYALYLLDGSLYFITGIWAVVVLLIMLRSCFGARLRNWAEHVSHRRFLQAVMVMSLFVLALEIAQLPFDLYQHHIGLKYGLSVQHWGSWFGDWGKSLLLGCVFASVLGWILYAIIRRSPRRWWFYFWVALIPIVIFVMFVEPVWLEPMFNK